MSEWQPIETAPKDGTKIIVFDHYDGVVIARWRMRWPESGYEWIEATGEEYENYRPTHWMPLPEPPK